MTLSLDRIQKAREAGYDDEKIIQSIEKRDPSFGSRIKKAREAGYDNAAIMESIQKKLLLNAPRQEISASEPVSKQPVSQQSETPDQGYSFFSPETDKSVNQFLQKSGESYKRGLNQSTSGLLAGNKPKTSEDQGFWQSLIEQAGTLTGDAPYIAAGATLGAMAGSPGGPLGAAAAGSFGSLAFPAFLKESIKEYHDYIDKGNDLTFSEFLSKADRVASKTLREGAFGVILGNVNKAMPYLEKIPGVSELFKYKGARPAAEIAAESATLAGVPALTEGRLPEGRDLGEALALVLGFKLANAPSAIKKIREASKEAGITEEQMTKELSKVSEGKIETEKELDNAIEKVKEPSEDISSMFGKMGSAISDNYYKQAFERIQQGKKSIANGVKDDLFENAKINYDKGLIKTEEDLRKFSKAFYEKFGKKGAQTQNKSSEQKIEPETRSEGTEIPEQKKEKKHVYEMNQKEIESVLKEIDDYDRRIIEPVVGKEIYDREYSGVAFDGLLRFWDKYGDKFTDAQADALEKSPYPHIDEVKLWLDKNKEYRTSYGFSKNKKEGLKEVISDLRSALINIEKPENIRLIKNAFEFLQSKGHSLAEIGQQIEPMIRSNLREADSEFVLDSIKKVFSQQKSSDKPLLIEKKQQKKEIGYEKEPQENKGSEKNVQALEKKIEQEKPKGDSAKIQVLAKNLQIQKGKVNKKKSKKKNGKKKKAAVPIIETTGTSAREHIDIPKTFSEKFIEGVNNSVDAIKNPGRTLSNTGKAINENVFNFLAPLEALESKLPVQDRASSRIKLAQSSMSTINSVIENGIFADVGTRVEHGGLREAYGDYTWKRLTKKIKPGEYSIEDFDVYRHSKESIQRQKEGFKTGIDTAEAHKDIAALKDQYEPVDARIQEYKHAVTETYGKDLLGPELIDRWNNQYHSSLYRVMDSGPDCMLSPGSLEPKNPFYRKKGSTRKHIPTSESDIYNTCLLIQNSKKNDAVLQYKRNVQKGLVPGKIVESEKIKMPKDLKKTLEVSDNLQPAADNLYGQTRAEAFTPSKNRLRGWEKGVQFEIEVPEQVVEVFKGMQPIQMGIISKTMVGFNRAFSKGLTLDPRKFFSIHSRDAWSAMIYSKTGVNPVDIAKATAEVLGDSDLYKQFKFDGGDAYSSRIASRMDRATKLEDLVTPGREGPIVPLDKAYTWFKKYENTLGNISCAVPFTEYKNALEKYGNTAEGRVLAMMHAKDVTYDPNRKGKNRLVREIAPFINYWNVTLQDAAMALGKNLKRPEVWAKGMATVTMPALALKFWNEGNPDYDDLTPLDKASFFHMFFGDVHVRLSSPWLLGTIFKVVPETMYEIAQGRGGEGLRGLYENAVEQVSGNFNPLIQSSIEVMTGRSPASPVGAFLGVESRSPEVIPRKLQSLPKELQYTGNTSVLSKNFAPLIGVSPVIMDRLVSNFGANIGKDALALIDEIAYSTGLADDKRPEKQLSNYLLLGNFVSNSTPSRTKYAEEFYQLRESLRVAKAGAKRGIPSERIAQLEKANLEKYNTEVNKRFNKLRNIQESDIPAVQKTETSNQVQKEINALYKQAVEKANR